LIPVGVKAWYDTKQLADLGIRLKNFIDLGTLAKQHLPNSPSGYSMKALADSNWKPHPFAKYAALDE
jgi:hypothetical protein